MAENRLSRWMLLLNLKGRRGHQESITEEDSLKTLLTNLDESLAKVSIPEDSRRVIFQDLERTRGDYRSFHQPDVQEWLARCLALFLEEHDKEYMQGLNEVLAPFIFLVSKHILENGTVFSNPQKNDSGHISALSTQAIGGSLPSPMEQDVVEPKQEREQRKASSSVGSIGEGLDLALGGLSLPPESPAQPEKGQEKKDGEYDSTEKRFSGSISGDDEEFPHDIEIIPSSMAYLLFSRFVERFQPCMFTKNDDEISTLRCHLALLNQLLPYFDPELTVHLVKLGMTPDIYATPWFVTVFARTTPIKVTLALWDKYLEEDYAPIHQFIVLAFILHHREVLLATHEEYIPETLTHLSWRSASEVEAVWARARRLMAATPRSFYAALEALCHDPAAPPALRAKLTHRLQAFTCMQIAASDVVDSLTAAAGPDGRPGSGAWAWAPPPAAAAAAPGAPGAAPPGPRRRRRRHGHTHCQFLVLDCRPESEVSVNYIKGAFFMNPKHLNTPQASPNYNGPYGELTQLLAKLQALPPHIHFCVVGNSSRKNSAAVAFAHLLLQRGFRKVGVVHQGYPALVAELETRGWLPKNGVYVLPYLLSEKKNQDGRAQAGTQPTRRTTREGSLAGGGAEVVGGGWDGASGLGIGGAWGAGEEAEQRRRQRVAAAAAELRGAAAAGFADSLHGYTQVTYDLRCIVGSQVASPSKAMANKLESTVAKIDEINKEIKDNVPLLASKLCGVSVVI